MRFTDYPEVLSEGNTYSTPEGKKKFVLNPSLSYYRRLLSIVIKSNLKVKRGYYDRYNWAASSFDIKNALEEVGIKINVSGIDNIRSVDEPVVFVSNHMSTLETMVLPSIIQPLKQVVFIIKEELTKYPLFGPIAAARHPICVGRANPREDLKIVMEEGAKRLNDGRSITIFPQKTRSSYLDKKGFNSLGIKLAKRCGVKVIPIALVTDAWGNGKPIKDFGKIDPEKNVSFEFGKPLKIEGNGSEQHNAVVDFIEDRFIEWGREKFII